MADKRHPNKHIREVIEFALERGWTLIPGRGHAFGILRCPFNCHCQKSVWSTPRVPENHAKEIRRYIEKCTEAAR